MAMQPMMDAPERHFKDYQSVVVAGEQWFNTTHQFAVPIELPMRCPVYLLQYAMTGIQCEDGYMMMEIDFLKPGETVSETSSDAFYMSPYELNGTAMFSNEYAFPGRFLGYMELSRLSNLTIRIKQLGTMRVTPPWNTIAMHLMFYTKGLEATDKNRLTLPPSP